MSSASKQARILQLCTEARLRRDALVAGGCSTYVLPLERGLPMPGITCLCCGLTSANPNDIEQKYCGFCQAFHSDWGPAGAPQV
jgi:hypothetical protein